MADLTIEVSIFYDPYYRWRYVISRGRDVLRQENEHGSKKSAEKKAKEWVERYVATKNAETTLIAHLHENPSSKALSIDRWEEAK